MDQPNRLNPTAMTRTVKRQTPKDEFGDLISNAATGAVKVGTGIIGSLAGAPIVSGAVSAVSSVAGQISAAAGAPATATAKSAATGIVTLGGSAATSNNLGPVGSTGITAGSSLGGLSSESSTYSDPQIQQMAQMSDYYLNLQNQMSEESREYNAVSNIIKVRHDSAKAAINNIH